MGNRKEVAVDQQRASVPAFGEWDEMKAAGVLPDYSLDFSKIRAVRMMQRKEGPPLPWSSTGGAGDAGEVAAGAGAGKTGRCARSSSADDVVVDSDRRRRRRQHHHRRMHSDGADLRRPLRQHDRAAPKERSKLLKGYLFCCLAG